MAKGRYQKWLESENLVLLEGWKRNGLIDKQIAGNMGISVNTLDKWKQRFVQIRQALKIGHESANYAVVKLDVFSTGAPIDDKLKQGVSTQIDEKSVLFHDELDNDNNQSKTIAAIIPATDGGCDVVYTATMATNQGKRCVGISRNSLPKNEELLRFLILIIEDKGYTTKLVADRLIITM
ncbi:hypothetical protein AALA17_04035 [Lactobacillaceae bacterium 24-114]